MRTLRYLFTFLLSYWSYIGVNSLSIPQNEFQHLLEHKEFPHFALFFCAKSYPICNDIFHEIEFLRDQLRKIHGYESKLRLFVVDPKLDASDDALSVDSFPALRWYSLQGGEYTVEDYDGDLLSLPSLVVFVSRRLDMPLSHLQPKVIQTTKETVEAYLMDPSKSTVLLLCPYACASLSNNLTMAVIAFSGDDTLQVATIDTHSAAQLLRRMVMHQAPAVVIFPSGGSNRAPQLLDISSVEALVASINSYAAVRRESSGDVVASSVVSIPHNQHIQAFLKDGNTRKDHLLKVVEDPAETLPDKEYRNIIRSVLLHKGSYDEYAEHVQDNLVRLERLLGEPRTLNPRARLKIMVKRAILDSLIAQGNEAKR